MAARRDAPHSSLDAVGNKTKSCTRGRRIGNVGQRASTTLSPANFEIRGSTLLDAETHRVIAPLARKEIGKADCIDISAAERRRSFSSELEFPCSHILAVQCIAADIHAMRKTR